MKQLLMFFQNLTLIEIKVNFAKNYTQIIFFALVLLPVYSFSQTNKTYLLGFSKNVSGPVNNNGIIFRYDVANPGVLTMKTFDCDDELIPDHLIQAANGKYYGVIEFGGTNHLGSIIEYDFSTNSLTPLFNFNGANGKQPCGSLIQAYNGKLYGTTIGGGNFDNGTLYELDITSPWPYPCSIKVHFQRLVNGSHPFGRLWQDKYNKLIYGLTAGDNSDLPPEDHGTLFEFDPVGGSIVTKYDFGTSTGSVVNGTTPFGGLTGSHAYTTGKLYGMTHYGGVNDKGVLFEYDINTGVFSKKIDLNTNTGCYPKNGTLLNLYEFKPFPPFFLGLTSSCGTNNYGTVFSYDPSTNAFVTLANFNGSNGRNPFGALIHTTNNDYYGLTSGGGGTYPAFPYATLFNFNSGTNTITKKISFNGVNGSYIGFDAQLAIAYGPSPPRTISTSEISLKVSPNPSKYFCDVSFICNKTCEYSIQVTDKSGHVYISQKELSNKGVNLVKLDVSKLPINLYFLKFQSSSYSETVQLMKF